jgi:hypothetical protein
MNWLSIKIAAPMGLALALPAQAAPAHAENRVALVIGNNDYKNVPKLQKAVRETGFIDSLDPRTRKRMPNPSIELAADAPAATLQLRYVDASGELQGPLPIRFDPAAALIRDQRKILDMTATSWLSFREFNGLLVYYTHLMSYRCAIREVRVGIDSAVPDRVVKMPPCDPRDASAIPHDSQPYLKLAPATKSVSVELTYRDGSVSEIKSFRR